MKTIYIIFTVLFTLFANAQCFELFSSEYQHSLALKTDGSLWSWGNNNRGELGLNTGVAPIYTPRLVSSQMAGAKIFTGGSKSFVIKNDGTLWACGHGDFFGLGTGTQNNKYALTQIGNSTDWSFITAGAGTIALKTNGTLWGWGSNIYGQLNLGTDSLQLTPIQISTETNWAKVVSGSNHTLAIKTNGTLWACGLNDYGQLGDGTITNRFNFIQIGTDTNWAELGSGYLSESSVAIKTDGTLWGWGSNLNSQLSASLPSQINVPTQIGTATNWSKVAKGYYATKGIKTDGTLWISSSSGLYQIGTDTDWVSIYSGEAHFFAMKSDGTLWGQGGNDFGQLGLGFAIQGTSVPTQLNCSAFLGTEQVNEVNKFTVFPNPTNNNIYIQNTSNENIEKITVTDVTGKIVFSTNDNFSEINMQSFESGVYILSVTLENKIYNYKIIKK